MKILSVYDDVEFGWQVPRLAYVAGGEHAERHLMQATLVGHYHSVRFFEDCSTVIEAFEREIPDLLIVDCLVPPFGGLRLLETVRRTLVGGDIPDAILCYEAELEEGEVDAVARTYEAVVLPERLVLSGAYFRTIVSEFVRLQKKRQGVLARA